MESFRKVFAISLVIILLLLTLFFIISDCLEILSLFIPDTLNEKDYKNFNNIGERLFALVDKGYVKEGEVIRKDGNLGNSYKDKLDVKKALSKYNNKIVAVYFVENNVILLSFAATFQSVHGIAVTRGAAVLNDTYDITGFDNGSLSYTGLTSNVYRFSAGL